MDNYSYNAAGELDYLVMPKIDLTNVTNPKLVFDVAYAPYNAAQFERLFIDYSTNNGSSYIATSYDKAHLDLATTGYQANGWEPIVATDWRTETIDISTYSSAQTNFRFIQETGYRNGLFIDNVRIITLDMPVANFNSGSGISCAGNVMTLTDQTNNIPTSWTWSISPNTFTYQNGTNANGTNSITKKHYVVGTGTVPFFEGFTNTVPPTDWALVNPDAPLASWEAVLLPLPTGTIYS